MFCNLRILVACEESQVVCKALRKLGHEAFSCDIVDCSGGHPEWHIKKDVREVLRKKWDMIIAFPPCTYFSTAGANRLFRGGVLNEDRYQKGLIMKDLFMNIYNADCEHIAIENPVTMKIWELPAYTQEIQPYHFGHPYTKKTRLWLKGLPKLEINPSNIVVPQKRWVSCGNKGKPDNSVCKSGRGESKRKRSETFQGIADAMARQWTDYILNS